LLADPIAVAANAPNPALNFYIVSSDGLGSERRHDGTDKYSMTINHSKGKVNDRHYLQIRKEVDSENPYTGATQRVVASVSIAIQIPKHGFSEAEIVDLVTALTDTLADADVTPLKLIQFQS
jgi:hypothetical protein